MYTFRALEAYDPVSNGWIILASMPGRVMGWLALS
jgi:hypothetical protein